MRGDRGGRLPDRNYIMGYSEAFVGLLRRRSAELNAAYLLPHLKPGHRVLDFGCGPGTISVGLARAVEPGELHGIDMEASQIEIARAAAVAGGHDNAVFHTGQVTDLPFADDTFDVAHCHAVLQHVPDTQGTLAEVKRVLKPGGVIASREGFIGSSFLEPEAEGGWELVSKLIRARGGHPHIGKELKRVFLEAGFVDVTVNATFESYSTPADIRYLHEFINDWFLSPEIIGAAIEYGLASRQQFDDWQLTLHRWKSTPSAFAALAWGEAIARKA